MGAANAGFEHATAPHGDVVVAADIMNFDGFGESADASDFSVDDAACAALKGKGGGAGVHDRFVEADRSAQFFLQTRVVVDVVVPKRLLDHQQIELIEEPEVLDLIEGVGGVRVATEGDVGPARADAFENVDVPAGLDFDFDATVAGG